MLKKTLIRTTSEILRNIFNKIILKDDHSDDNTIEITKIGEISYPKKYGKESSSINFKRIIILRLGVLCVYVFYFLQKTNQFKFKL